MGGFRHDDMRVTPSHTCTRARARAHTHTLPPPAHRLSVSQALTTSYKLAMQSLTRYEDLRVVHEFCTTFDAATYNSGTRDVVQFRKDMSMIKCVQCACLCACVCVCDFVCVLVGKARHCAVLRAQNQVRGRLCGGGRGDAPMAPLHTIQVILPCKHQSKCG